MPSTTHFPRLAGTNDAGERVYRRKAKIATVGDFTHRGTGEDLTITRERAAQWEERTNALLRAGVVPPVLSSHPAKAADGRAFSCPSARDTAGAVVCLELERDGLYAIIDLHGDDSLALAARNSRSVGIVSDQRDAYGNVYAGESLQHLALVPSAALPDLGGLAIAASAWMASAPAFTAGTAGTAGMTDDRRRELLSLSGLGRDVLADQGETFADPAPDHALDEDFDDDDRAVLAASFGTYGSNPSEMAAARRKELLDQTATGKLVLDAEAGSLGRQMAAEYNRKYHPETGAR